MKCQWHQHPGTACENKATAFYVSTHEPSEGFVPQNRAVCEDCASRSKFDDFAKRVTLSDWLDAEGTEGLPRLVAFFDTIVSLIEQHPDAEVKPHDLPSPSKEWSDEEKQAFRPQFGWRVQWPVDVVTNAFFDFYIPIGDVRRWVEKSKVRPPYGVVWKDFLTQESREGLAKKLQAAASKA